MALWHVTRRVTLRSGASCATRLAALSNDARRSNLSESTIRDFEKGRRIRSPNNLAAICRALEAAAVEFTNGDAPGVRMKRS
ncbi:MAG: helix-turn-helix domain-containing protein [Methyloceanibacter sp.]|jgi:hypothetical protein